MVVPYEGVAHAVEQTLMEMYGIDWGGPGPKVTSERLDWDAKKVWDEGRYSGVDKSLKWNKNNSISPRYKLLYCAGTNIGFTLLRSFGPAVGRPQTEALEPEPNQIRDVQGPRRDLLRLRAPENVYVLNIRGSVESLAGLERLINLRRISIERLGDPELERLSGVAGQLDIVGIATHLADVDFSPL